MRLLLLTQLVSTLTMVGVIWFVQVVHYPLFGTVGESAFTDYEREHQRLTSYVVVPLMLVEVGSSLLLFFLCSHQLGQGTTLFGLAMVVAIWATTFLIQVPIHGQLATGFDQLLVERLVATNWLRTALWTGRGVFVVWLVAKVMGT